MEQTQPQNEQQKRHERRFYMIGQAFAFVAYGILFLTLDVETELSWTHPYLGVGFLIAAYFLIVAPCLDALLSKMECFVKKMWPTLWVVTVLAVAVALFQALEKIPHGDWRWVTLLCTVTIFLIVAIVTISICPIQSVPEGLRVVGDRLKSIGASVKAIGCRVRDSARKYVLLGTGTFLAFAILTVGISAKFNLSNITASPYKFIEDYFDHWSALLSACVTAILAIIAFWSIMENRRIRLEDRHLESERRALSEVIQWASELQTQILLFPADSISLSDIRLRTMGLIWRSHSAALAAGVLGKEFQDKTNELVDGCKTLLNLASIALKDPEKEDTPEKVGEVVSSLVQCCNQVFEAAYGIKSERKL